MAPWDQSVDFLVVGSGAAGMSGALRAHDLGARVLVVEKASVYGGTTAMSGGICWVGNNPSMRAKGLEDGPDEVLAYLRAITRGEVPDALLVTYRDESLRVVDYFARHSHVLFEAMESYTDYYPEAPGGKLGGRTMDPVPFDGSKLGDDFALLRRPALSAMILGRILVTPRQAKHFVRFGVRTFFYVAWLFLLYALRFPKRRRMRGRDPFLAQGNALAARLRMSLKDRDVPIWLETSLVDLVVEAGRVVGAVVEREGRTLRIETRRGVLLGSGGFERNLAMRTEHGPKPASIEWSAAAETNTGDGILIGKALGAKLALLDEAWWTPVTQYPGAKSGWVLVLEKSLPGGIFVDRRGRRFTNEAAPYGDVVAAIHAHERATGAAVPAFHVFDARYRRHYLAGPVAPGIAMPDSALPRRLRESFLVKADSIAALASKLGIEEGALEATIVRFNAMAARGVDDDFHRGESAADRYYGDPRAGANPCLAPIAKPPFYAMRIYPGDLGTKGGLVTDVRACVLREDGSRIEGLYAAGNATASMMGRTYPGAGGTIGPALTFGFLAAEDAMSTR